MGSQSEKEGLFEMNKEVYSKRMMSRIMSRK